MKRWKHTLSHYRMHTCDMGELIPIQCVPVLPGDTMQGNQTIVIRCSPLNTPVMHPTTVRVHTWFMPNRLAWPESEGGGWEQFITGGPDGNDNQTVPFVGSNSQKKQLLSYLGVPPTSSGRAVNALPLRMVNRIFNQRYRDQDLVAERAENDVTIPLIAWEKDDLTTARPFTQKGPDVTIPIGDKAPVKTDATVAGGFTTIHDGTDQDRRLTSGGGELTVGNLNTGEELYADLASATQVNINDFRAAFSIQRYQEARARYGSRFVEYLRYLGIRPSDARLQEPEYISGGTARLNFSEVLQTAPNNPGTDQNGIGEMFGHGIAGVRTPKFRKFFEEHGFLITLLSVRPKATYLNGVDREWLKKTKEDYFQRELANLGQQDVYKGQVFLDQNEFMESWGFQDRYDEYRRHPSYVAQDFRDLLNSYHMGRELDASATLNEDFVKCNPSKRIFQVQDNDVLWIMINNHLVARRMVPKRANPRIM